MRTRDGRKVRIFCCDGGGKWPVMGAWLNADGIWIAGRWSLNGRGGAAPLDIVTHENVVGLPTVDHEPVEDDEFHADSTSEVAA